MNLLQARFLIVLVALFQLAVTPILCAAAGRAAPAKPAPDVVVFTNGDQLTGKLARAVAGSVVFKSDMAGELTIPFTKIRELRSGSDASQFALLRKGLKPKQLTTAPEGPITYADGEFTMVPMAQAPITIRPADVAYLVDKATYDKSVAHVPSFREGWNGTVTGGATVVRSSSNGTTLTAAANLVRDIPTVPYLPARNRTVVNIAESYGTLTTVAPPPPSASVKTSIFHADAERDEYFRPVLYALVDGSFDHNYSQGLQLQQTYGAGIGWTPVKTAKQELNVKGDVHYERQTYFLLPGATPPVTPAVTLFGSTIGESYIAKLPHKIVFTETGSYLPAWTQLHDYAGNITLTLAAPVYKRLSVSATTTDNYLNDPAAGALSNSFQFITGVTYTLH